MSRLAAAPIYLAGFLGGAGLLVAPWVVGFPHGQHGAWGPATWSVLAAGAVMVSTSGVALVATVGLAVAAATREGRERRPD